MASLSDEGVYKPGLQNPENDDPFSKDTLLNYKDETDKELLEKETRCGIGSFSYPWMQKLASKKAYVLVYGLIGMVNFAFSAYFVATISTMEKRFQIPSTFTGIISSSWDIGSICTNLVVTYLGRDGHKTRWVAMGAAIMGFSCFMRVIPHLLYGPGESALLLTREFGSDFKSLNVSDTSGPKMTLCGNNFIEHEDCINASSGNISAYIFLVAHLIIGVGGAVYYTLGVAYMDDNAKKNKTPLLLALWQCLRMLGPTFGYMLASYALNMYVDPLLTPVINNKDPRWIGAWWFGWAPFGFALFALALIMAMFPRSLPRTVERSMAAAAAAGRTYNPQEKAQKSFADFITTIKRLMKNKILVCNTFSSVCFILGLVGQWTFTPKYMETQFHQSAASASMISGTVGLLCTAAGLMVSGLVISKFKPNARKLAGWNVITESLDCLGYFLMTYIGCESLNIPGTTMADGTLNLELGCNANCSCPASIRYSPVCHEPSGTTFFSPCHAGCADASWGEGNSSTKIFSACSCVADSGPVVDGECSVDCSHALFLFIAVQCVQRFLGATGKAGNTLVHFRCVTPEDKPVAIGFSEFLFCALAFIPAPIIFGWLVDQACIVWGHTCGKTGNCWLYDVDKLRLLMNIPIVGCLFVGTLWDIGVWYHVKGLQLYDDEDVPDEKESKKGHS